MIGRTVRLPVGVRAIEPTALVEHRPAMHGIRAVCGIFSKKQRLLVYDHTPYREARKAEKETECERSDGQIVRP